ncbi:MAG: hypothetical protein A3G24_15210 [Betaproteobacteria bacterium RIFCSPLOWO2_12_FULL_62_13]|nr:MAG: hypothetical protein A3G24_15210 [Betaproteobacteria bacterium RIFCSPLOWO2_12_FULL_62_13]
MTGAHAGAFHEHNTRFSRDEEDYRFYLDCLLDASRKYGCSIHAYVLMTNLVHRLASAKRP